MEIWKFWARRDFLFTSLQPYMGNTMGRTGPTDSEQDNPKQNEERGEKFHGKNSGDSQAGQCGSRQRWQDACKVAGRRFQDSRGQDAAAERNPGAGVLRGAQGA